MIIIIINHNSTKFLMNILHAFLISDKPSSSTVSFGDPRGDWQTTASHSTIEPGQPTSTVKGNSISYNSLRIHYS